MNKFARLAMRTRFEIVVADDIDPAAARAACDEAFDEIERIEAQLSAYRSESALSYLNSHVADEPVRVDPRLFRLLQRAVELCGQACGAFDITVGPLLRCWGFLNNMEGISAEKINSPEFQQELARARELVGMREKLELDPAALTVHFRARGVRLDPGAIGKGYALDCAAEILRDAGIRNALLHGGTSTVRAMGSPADTQAWKIAIQHPLDAEKLLATAHLRDNSLSVSAVHGKSFTIGGRRFGHVIDPRTGEPVLGALLAAYITESATDSDALSTGLLVLGKDGIAGLIQKEAGASMLVAYAGDSMELKIALAGCDLVLQ